jgi:hypothetical protein
MGTNTMLTYEEVQQAEEGSYTLYTPISASRFMLPYWNPYKKDGSIASSKDGSWKGTTQNPIEWMATNPQDLRKYKLLSTVYAEATLDGRDIADATFTYDVTFPRDAQQYSGTTVSISGLAAATLGTAFQMQPTSINSRMQGWSASGPGNRRIMFYAVNPDGSLAQSGSTANGYGHWFDQTATVNAYANGYVFSEFSPSSLVFSLGQYPGKNANGSKYTISQALVYKNGSKTATARFIFNITIGGDVNVTLRSIDYTDPSTVGIQNVENVSRRVENVGIYDLSGRRISVTSASSVPSVLPKGVYIKDGKKVVVR